ncbi:MAG TPA: FAD-dependent oxidoreductase, partial [Actinomycetota bacterium]
MPTFVAVGASLAGGTAAATLREEGFDGRIVLIGDEPVEPYERHPLSKEYLRGEQPFDRAYLRPPQFWKENRIDARLGERAERIDTTNRSVVMASGERVPYDAVLLATGCRNRRLPVPGADLPGVFELRKVADADAIKVAAGRARKAVVVGAGFIGCEVTASLRQLGLDVMVVESAETPLQQVLGADLGRVLEGLHRDHGVEMVLGDATERFEGAGTFEALVTRHGRRIEADFAVVGVGVEPVTELAHGSDIAVQDGI